MPARFILLVGCICLATGHTAIAEIPQKSERKVNRDKEQKPKTVVIAGQRTYRLEVESVSATLHATFMKQWSFSGEFPAELLRGIRKNPDLKKSKLPFFPVGDKNADWESGYIRWRPDGKRQPASAILWFVNSNAGKAAVISVDLPLDHTLGQSRPPLQFAFDQLHFSIDLKTSKMSAVRWGKVKLPNETSKSPAIEVEASQHVTITGRLTDESARSIRLANHLLSEDFMQKLGGMGRVDLSNDSHHGISLGWLGYERVRHSLLFGPVKPANVIAFRYRVSGTTFPLRLVSRQIRDDGWPLVLRGREYVGSTADGVSVFRPVEYHLSKRPSKKALPKKRNR